MHKLKCLRCDVPMQFVKRENVQLGKTGFLIGDWGNLLAGALDVAIYTCPVCGTLEFFRGELYDEPAEDTGISKTTCLNCGTQHELDDPKC
ncbi:MAG: hypothetical protein J6Q14_00045, partial [Oscillospiraceae bacterium]|nr:hypothetical protein [Oscillospiraceae bacterium]